MTPALITALLQLFALVFKSWMDWKADTKQIQKERRDGWKEAAKSGDVSVINSAIDKLRT